jgi:hypothetical protein
MNHASFVSSGRTAPRPIALGGVTEDWRAAAITAYRRSEHQDTLALQDDLAAHILTLTQRAIRPAMIAVDRDARLAIAVVDNIMFRLHDRRLSIMRPCIGCGYGQYVSLPIASPADLGHALSGWEPRCSQCELDDPAEDWTHSF